MDFNAFDSVAASEKGADCHVVHPANGQPLFDNPGNPTVDNGKPCVVIVAGGESPEMRKILRAEQKERAHAADASEDEVFVDDLHDQMSRAVLPRILGFKNIKNGAKSATKEDAAWFLGLNRMNLQDGEKSFVEQVFEFSNQRSNYLGNG